MSKSCFVIASYCDNQLKVDVLDKCINNLKEYNIDICLCANYPLNTNIQKKVNYYLFDKSNPIFKFPEHYMIHWQTYRNIKMIINNDDYGYTHLQQIRRGFDFMKSNNYNKIIFINYDAFIGKKLFNKINNDIDNYDASLLYWNKNNLNMAIFGITTKIDLNHITKNNYKSFNGFAEQFFKNTISKFNIIKNDHNTYNKIEDFYTMMDFNGNSEYKQNNFPISEEKTLFSNFNDENCRIHIGNYNGNVGIFIFDIQNNSKINLNINNKIITYKNVNDYILHEIKIKYDEFINNNITIEIEVNNKMINQKNIDLFKKINSYLNKI
jgi:hypothetical protein